MMYDVASGVQFDPKKADSMSNESPNKVLQDAHVYYWSQ